MTVEHVAGESPVRGVLQRTCACGGGASCARCGDGELARSATGPEPDGVPSSVHDSLRSPGRPLDDGVRAEVEGRLGHDLRDVRIHSDHTAGEAATAVHARAFTVGNDVVFAPGRFQPGTPDGRKLLLHELTHTVQQRGVSRRGDLRVGASGTAAEAQADGVASGTARPIDAGAGPPVVQRQALPEPVTGTPLGGVNLSVDGGGRVDVTVVGPKAPVVGQPALGLRRRPGRTIEFLFGNSSRVVTPGEVPALLRGSLDQSGRQPAGIRTPLPLRIPTCEEMRKPDGSAKPWVEHRLEQVLQGRQPLSQPFYEGLVSTCPPAPAEEPLPGPEPAGPPTMPVSSDEALA